MRQDGQRRLYVVRPEGLDAIRELLEELWPASLEQLKRAVESDRGA
jgi:hypothetical protein